MPAVASSPDVALTPPSKALIASAIYQWHTQCRRRITVVHDECDRGSDECAQVLGDDEEDEADRRHVALKPNFTYCPLEVTYTALAQQPTHLKKMRLLDSPHFPCSLATLADESVCEIKGRTTSIAVQKNSHNAARYSSFEMWNRSRMASTRSVFQWVSTFSAWLMRTPRPLDTAQ
uniref:Uncharacterized protein n=1 Tax=Pristionchus pacificus TaxID=54126 RepID=A0A2A6CQF9_PRIPA|eukprot:PDM80297.1 hypothetical protein PRIPAC_32876 [Pristionchus pacificus]